MNSLIRFFLERRLFTALVLILLTAAGLAVAPFNWVPSWFPRAPLAVDAIPDIGENQQIVYSEWQGRSPQDVENQVTYPLTTALLGLPGVKAVRSSSMFGFSSIYVIFEDGVEFYWSRSRIVEKLGSLPPGLLPEGVRPSLGPDATALGQVFWYTLEPKPGVKLDLHELRSLQDWTVRYALGGVQGVSEVASIGGYVREYQVELDPSALVAHNVSMEMVMAALQGASAESGAGTLEVNRVEYFVRGLGFVRSVEDLEEAIVDWRKGTPLRLRDVAKVQVGPAMTRGWLDDSGRDAVGGVVVARHGANPREVIAAVRERIKELETGLPVRIVPFYDRTKLIDETVATLESALLLQMILAALVVMFLQGQVRASLVVSSLLPVSVLLSFLAMKLFGMEANIVALAGIAIAIGTLVDLGIILTESVLEQGEKNSALSLQQIAEGSKQVAGPIITALSTTVISFFPVLALQEAEGKMFRPLAMTKTFALIAALFLTLFVVPTLLSWLYTRVPRLSEARGNLMRYGVLAMLIFWLSWYWRPLGLSVPYALNILLVGAVCLTLLQVFAIFRKAYAPMLVWCLNHKRWFLVFPLLMVLGGSFVWSRLGREFLPPLDEGAFLVMPTLMPHAGVEETREVMRSVDKALAAIPEVERVVGKLGRVESPLDPAPLNMLENVVLYKSEYGIDSAGRRIRQWRDHIRNPRHIWDEISAALVFPGLTGAPRLQPIETRLVMLQSGMRSAMGLKVQGPDLKTVEAAGLILEKALRKVPAVRSETVFAERLFGKPYVVIKPDRAEMARVGISMQSLQMALETFLGGMPVATTIEGRQRVNIRMRWPRELRSSPQDLQNLLLEGADKIMIPLGQVASVEYERGPEAIRAEDTFLTGFVLFDGQSGADMGKVARSVTDSLRRWQENGELILPENVHWRLAGTWENQMRAQDRLQVLVPLALLLVFLILYLQFRAVVPALLVFVGIATAFGGGFIAIGAWNYFGFGLDTMHLSVAVWVGFLALFGIATDDGVVMLSTLREQFARTPPLTISGVRSTVLTAGMRRIRPCLMTTATTVLALLPVLTSKGRGADLMIPMALPVFGGMIFALVTLFLVPVLFSAWREKSLNPEEDTNATEATPSFIIKGNLLCLGILLGLGMGFTPKAMASPWPDLQLLEKQIIQQDPFTLAAESRIKQTQARRDEASLGWESRATWMHSWMHPDGQVWGNSKVGAEITLPWPTVTNSRGKAWSYQLQAQQQMLQQVVRQRLLFVRIAYVQWLAAKKEMLVLDSLIMDWEQLRPRLHARQAAGIEGLQGEAELDLMLAELRTEHSAVATTASNAWANLLVCCPQIAAREPANNSPLPPWPIWPAVSEIVPPSLHWENQLPQIQVMEARKKSAEAMEKMEQGMRLPMLMAGVEFDMMERSWMPRLGLSIPLRSAVVEARRKQMQAEQEMLEQESLAMRREIVAQAAQWHSQEKGLLLQLEQLSIQQEALYKLERLLRASYHAGEVNLEYLLDTARRRLALHRARLKIEMEQIQVRAQAYSWLQPLTLEENK